MTRRREFITLLGGAAAAWPLAARAQQGERVRRVGVLFGFSDSDAMGNARAAAFRQGLEKVGWAVGRNLIIDYRWSIYFDESARAAAAELLRMSPDVILTYGTTALRAAQQATRTTPIVFTVLYEPVAQGFVQSLSHPGGNITGFTNVEPNVGGKWVELLTEIAPGVSRLLFIFNPEASPYSVMFYRSIATAATKFGVDAAVVPVQDVAEIEQAIAKLAREPGGGLIAGSDNFTIANRKPIIELAARHRIPAIYGFRDFMPDGGLMFYGADLENQFRLAAGYVDRIFRGESPADLAVQQPTKFELIINLKTAKALSLDVPLSLQQGADEVIE